MTLKPTAVKPLNGYSIFVEFSDGVKGSVDLTHLAHRGVFRAWDDGDIFQKVHIAENGAIAWNENIDICPDNVYLKLTGLTFEEWQMQNGEVHAAN
ncbi:MAG: DUF2442 domain-containing protein [Kiritimatiellaeota bacterium]|nr:DUF2442 domain-containing protein [Kiritimatiellota bacterium]